MRARRCSARRAGPCRLVPTVACLAATLAGCTCLHGPARPGLTHLRLVQPVQHYFVPLRGPSPFRRITHLGTDCGPMGPAALTWAEGSIRAAPRRDGQWAGMWHSLAGLAREKRRTLDLARCYPPFIRDAWQPRCVAIVARARGTGRLELELKAPDERVLWQATARLDSPTAWSELRLPCRPARVPNAKFLTWLTRAPADLSIDSIGLELELPPMPFPERVFLASYAKLARCYAPAEGVVRDRAHTPAGRFDNVPASGMFCLATCAAWRLGIVDRAFAQETLRRVHHTVGSLPRACGLLPHFISRRAGRYRIHPGTEYSTVDTSLTTHAMLLAAQMLGDRETLAELTRAVRGTQFDKLRDAEGYVLHGLATDGRTPLRHAWRGWGGETALVLLLERMAAGDAARLRMKRTGKVYRGVGFIAELQSLFYPHFSRDEPDAVTGVNWLAARRALLAEQMACLPRHTAAARLGLYGLSAGEGPRGVGYVANGTRTTPRGSLIHPHYLLMSACLRPPHEVLRVLEAMEARGLLPPWGLVENVSTDLREHLPMLGGLNAAFEALAAYHLWAKATGRPDAIYAAARASPPLADAVRAFYPEPVLLAPRRGAPAGRPDPCPTPAARR